MKYIIFAASFAALAACETTPYEPFVSNSQSPERTPRTFADASTPDGMRCENIQVIGSRTPAKRVCQSEEMWNLMRENSQEIVRDLERIPIPTEPTG